MEQSKPFSWRARRGTPLEDQRAASVRPLLKRATGWTATVESFMAGGRRRRGLPNSAARSPGGSGHASRLRGAESAVGGVLSDPGSRVRTWTAAPPSGVRQGWRMGLAHWRSRADDASTPVYPSRPDSLVSSRPACPGSRRPHHQRRPRRSCRLRRTRQQFDSATPTPGKANATAPNNLTYRTHPAQHNVHRQPITRRHARCSQ